VADPSVVLLTTAQPNLDDETPLLIDALAGTGVTAGLWPWTAPVPTCDLVVIRSTWDYPTQPAAFLAALASIAAPVWNPVEIVQWNSHKGYLLDVAAAGVPVVPTTLVRPTDPVRWPDGPLVIKPAISADAMGTPTIRRRRRGGRRALARAAHHRRCAHPAVRAGRRGR